MEFVDTSITWHVYAIMVLVLIMIFNLFSVLIVQDYFSLVKRLKLMTPIYHSMNAVVAYTGGIVAAFSKDLSITVILMIATSIFIMVLEIKRFKKMRVIKLSETDKQIEFRAYAKKIYTIEITAVIFTYVISKIF
jgi:4-hydroxybenzoate polyprenyltransferase